MSLKPFRSVIDQSLWEEVKSLHTKSSSNQKIIDQIKSNHNITLSPHSVRKLTKYFDFQELELIPTFSQNNSNSHNTKDFPNRENYIGWVKDKLIEIGVNAINSNKHDLFFKCADRLIQIFRIERPLEIIQSYSDPDAGKAAFQAELRKLIVKPAPVIATLTDNKITQSNGRQ